MRGKARRMSFISRRAGWFFVSACALVTLLISASADPAWAGKSVKVKPAAQELPGFNDFKYADLIIDADSGKVLHATNANARRYPASLTKMMTLYLTFDAIKRGKMTLDTPLRVSAKAATMPQTNLALKEGGSITVRDAIKALVVRSANDVAVVLAESLGKTEWNFAVMMTAKARQLGMNQTVFKNASGLPEPAQYTTARDLAVLAIALKKHFPNQYHFFKTTSFTFNGTTYKSHNRVLERYADADGLKTGYIRASGFNLATSANRGGRNLVGVVLGGDSWKVRDDRMIALLDQGYAMLGQQPGAPQFARATAVAPAVSPVATAKASTSNVLMASAAPVKSVQAAALPMPVAKPGTPAAKAEALEGFKLAFREKLQTAEQAKPTFAFLTKKADAVPAGKKMERREAMAAVKASSMAAQPGVQVAGLAPVGVMPTASERQFTPTAPGQEWGIQVGAFNEQKEALMAAAHATQVADRELKTSVITMGETQGQGAEATVYRARLANLTERQARNACRKIISQKESCFVFKLGEEG